MSNYTEVLDLEKLPPGTGIAIKVEDNAIALFNVDGTVYVIGNSCPHAGGSLGGGRLDGKIVTCRMHGMKFDVTTGFFNGTTSFGVQSYPVKVGDGKIFISFDI